MVNLRDWRSHNETKTRSPTLNHTLRDQVFQGFLSFPFSCLISSSSFFYFFYFSLSLFFFFYRRVYTKVKYRICTTLKCNEGSISIGLVDQTEVIPNGNKKRGENMGKILRRT